MKTIAITLLTIFILAAGGCTRNDGNIGKQFGQWKLMSISRDGADDPSYKGNIYWSFQNTTIEMKEVTDEHEAYQAFGSYRISDNTMFLSFTDPDFPPRPVAGLPRECELQILKLTGSSMVLAYGEPATIYTFRKW